MKQNLDYTEEEMGFDIHIQSYECGQTYCYLPYCLLSNKANILDPYGFTQSLRLQQQQMTDDIGEYDLIITTDLTEIEIDQHIQKYTHVNFNTDINFSTKNNEYQVYIVENQVQNRPKRRQWKHRKQE